MKKSRKIIALLIILCASILFVATIYISKQFSDVTIEQLLFHMNTEVGGGSKQVVIDGILACIIPIIILTLIAALPIFIKIYNTSTTVEVTLHTKKYFFRLRKPIIIYSFTILFIVIMYAFQTFHVVEYIQNKNTNSQLIMDEYVDPRSVQVTFPEKKKNLIYIFLESMEMTYADKNSGGAFDQSLILELQNLASENINFSNTNKLGGALGLTTTHWTIAGMTAQTAGLPLKSNYLTNGSFLPNAITLGDILAKENYNQMLVIGSPAGFGSRNLYFGQHGNYEIIDYKEAKNKNYIPEDYLKWWGYEDKKLFDIAKENLTKLASKGKPFNFTMLTADTHFTDGYLDTSCPSPFDTQYENVFACSSSMVASFISWIQEQDFYQNTTIVLVGDHLGMQTSFYENLDPNYQRVIYNTFINSSVTSNTYHNRMFSSFDLFPTTLASMGVKIEGNRLGLGVNLFSQEKTILEKYSYSYVEDEIKKNSFFYDSYFSQK